MYIHNAPNTSAPFAEGLLPDTLNAPAPCALAQSAESLVMWAPVAQLQLWLTHPLSLPIWVTSEGFEPEPQSYDGGNVTVEDPPISFSPFTLADCMLFSHFSFNDWVATRLSRRSGHPDLGSPDLSPFGRQYHFSMLLFIAWLFSHPSTYGKHRYLPSSLSYGSLT